MASSSVVNSWSVCWPLILPWLPMSFPLALDRCQDIISPSSSPVSSDNNLNPSSRLTCRLIHSPLITINYSIRNNISPALVWNTLRLLDSNRKLLAQSSSQQGPSATTPNRPLLLVNILVSPINIVFKKSPKRIGIFGIMTLKLYAHFICYYYYYEWK